MTSKQQAIRIFLLILLIGYISVGVHEIVFRCGFVEFKSENLSSRYSFGQTLYDCGYPFTAKTVFETTGHLSHTYSWQIQIWGFAGDIVVWFIPIVLCVLLFRCIGSTSNQQLDLKPAVNKENTRSNRA